MESASGRYVIAFNGEIYNHKEIRCKVQGVKGKGQEGWRGHSDTETLLAAIECWGVEKALKHSVGMFSLALWDKQQHALTLARDRFGEKPLYYGWVNGDFVFGSELKAVRAYPGFSNPICRRALAQYLRFMYVPAPASIYENIYKLEPGSYLQVEKQGQGASSKVQVVRNKRYWSFSDTVSVGRSRTYSGEADSLAALETALSESVEGQMLADVPLGAFLSGGVDSSLIVSLMKQRSANPVKTFTVGFEEAGFDESPHARAVAAHLGTEHHEMFVSAQEAQDVIPQLPWMFDEPFADSSQIPTHLVCKAARQHVTVALSGDGGDELFSGYNRYFWGPRVWNKLGKLPYPLRQFCASGLQGVSPSILDRLLGHEGVVRPGEKLHKLGRALVGARSIDDFYQHLLVEWRNTEGLVKELDNIDRSLVRSMGAGDRPGHFTSGLFPTGGPEPMSSLLAREEPELKDPRERMMYRDAVSYLPDDILCKVDRAAMAASLETRVPFLDHRVAEVASRLPLSMKIRGNEGKWALRQILYKHVPRELIERPKAGFAIPIGQWLRGPLREWAEGLLSEARLEREGYFYSAPIRQAWRQHLSTRYDWTNRIWAVLMFQSWLESQ